MKLNDYSVRIPEGNETHSGYVELPHNQEYSITIRNDRDVDCIAQVHVDGKDVGRFHIKAKSNLRVEHPEDCNRRFLFLKGDTGEYEAAEGGNVEADSRGLVQVSFFPLKKKETEKTEVDRLLEAPRKYLSEEHHYHHYHDPQHYPPWPYVQPRPYWYSGSYWQSTTLGASNDAGEQHSVLCSAEGQPDLPANNRNYAAGITGLGSVSDQELPVADLKQGDEPLYETTISLRLVAVPEQRKTVAPLRPIVRGNPVPPPVST